MSLDHSVYVGPFFKVTRPAGLPPLRVPDEIEHLAWTPESLKTSVNNTSVWLSNQRGAGVSLDDSSKTPIEFTADSLVQQLEAFKVSHALVRAWLERQPDVSVSVCFGAVPFYN